MKKNKLITLKIIILGSLMVLCISISFAQTMMYVDEISYSELEKNCLLLPPNAVLDDIDPLDMSELEYVEVELLHHEAVDSEGNPQSTTTVMSSVNSFDQVEGLHTKWLSNQVGFSSFLDQGQGNFVLVETDSLNFQESALYNVWKNRVAAFGQLTNLVFPQDITSILTNQGIPYQTTTNGHIYVTNENQYVIWIPGAQSSSIVTLRYAYNGEMPGYIGEINTMDPTLESVVISTYDILYCQEQFKSSTIEVLRDTLSNGLCVKRLMEKYFSNYEFDMDCRSSSRNSNTEYGEIGETQISVFPNPLYAGVITIDTKGAFEGEYLHITLKSLDGQTIFQDTRINSDNLLRVSLDDQISASGLYIIEINDEINQRATKFYFINQ